MPPAHQAGLQARFDVERQIRHGSAPGTQRIAQKPHFAGCPTPALRLVGDKDPSMGRREGTTQ